MSLKEYQTLLEKRKAEGKKTSAYRTKITSLKVNGKTAVASTVEISDAIAIDPKTRRMRKTVRTHTYRDTWVNMKGVWRLKRTEARGEKSETATP